MGKLGTVLGGFVGVGLLMIGMRDAWDEVYEVMNTTVGMTSIENLIWRFAPIAIPIAAVIGGVIVLVRRRDNRREGFTEWRD
jgi:hypothetical protein